MKRIVMSAILAVSLLGVATPGDTVVTTQLLDYEKGWVFITTGDGFHVAPDVQVINGPAEARRYARLTFDGSGVVTRIEISNKKLPPEGDLSAIHRFAVSLSPEVPNPELVPKSGGGLCSRTVGGRMVAVKITVEVPPTTAQTDNVYMTSDQSGWSPQAYRLDRIDGNHYRTTVKFSSGTIMHVLFDRGSSQSIQVGENGLDMQPLTLCIGDEDAQAFRATVYRWGDEKTGGIQPIPQAMPTPYNPAPFPNLPQPPSSVPTPHP